jgi:hypothetical protein
MASRFWKPLRGEATPFTARKSMIYFLRAEVISGGQSRFSIKDVRNQEF